jgi:hypothetical protein
VRETLARVRAAGASGPLYLRADAGFYTQAVVAACQRHGARFSITVRQLPALQQVIAAIPATAWSSTGWPDQAQVAALPYRPFKRRRGPRLRLVVTRVPEPSGPQLRLLPAWHYHAFVTDRPGAPVALAAEHRRHAQVEHTIRDLKYGLGLNHFPSGRFGANGAWLALNLLAHNLARWLARWALRIPALLTTKTLRRRLFSLPGRLTRSARRYTLHLPARWPWAQAFLAALARLRALPPPAPASA